MNIDYYRLGPMQGWQCPICNRILAPFMSECPCKGERPQTLSTTYTLTMKQEEK